MQKLNKNGNIFCHFPNIFYIFELATQYAILTTHSKYERFVIHSGL